MIMNIKPGDKVKLTKRAPSDVSNLLDKELSVLEIIHDEMAALEHIEECGPENVNTCSCCNYAKVEGSNFAFYIEEGDSELEKVER